MSNIEVQQLSCATKIDYSSVPTGGKKLPFTVELDLVNSVLTPAAGEKQKFCYQVIGVGKDLGIFADLSHFLFGICPEAEGDLTNIQVFIDGQAQIVTFGEGGNVELKTLTNPDNSTGCVGLKFDFPVKKVTGSIGSQLSLCFELKTNYSLGEMTVCLFGGNTATHALALCGPVCVAPPPPTSDCEIHAFQRVGICVPVTVVPYAYPGDVTTICCGSPVITSYLGACQGTTTECTFTVTQAVCITVPLTFGAEVAVGEAKIECDEPSVTDSCQDCT